jgi:hypothetical protein
MHSENEPNDGSSTGLLSTGDIQENEKSSIETDLQNSLEGKLVLIAVSDKDGVFNGEGQIAVVQKKEYKNAIRALGYPAGKTIRAFFLVSLPIPPPENKEHMLARQVAALKAALSAGTMSQEDYKAAVIPMRSGLRELALSRMAATVKQPIE